MSITNKDNEGKLLNILGIMGSGRKNSNSGNLMRHSLDSINDSYNCRTESILLGDYRLEACKGCEQCNRTGVCVIKDDMNELYDKVSDADIIIFASPVYFYGVPGHSKIFIDRFQPYWAKKYLLKDIPPQKRTGGLIGVAGSKGSKVFDCLFLPVKYMFDTLNADIFPSLFFRNWDNQPSDLTDEMIEKAKFFGTEIVNYHNEHILKSEQ